MEKTIAGNIVLEYLNKYPTMPSLTLSRLILQCEPESFSSIENIRSSVRYYRKSTGKKNGNKIKDDRLARIWQEAKFNLPEGRIELRNPYELPKVNNRILLLYDVHVPFYDDKAYRAAVEWGVEHKVNTVVFGGDFVDFYEHSDFQKDPRVVDLWGSVADAYEVMAWTRDRLPNAKFYYMIGNHEYRLERGFMRKYPEMFVLTDYTLDDVTKFSDFDVTYLKHRQLLKIGDMFGGHGDEFGRGGITVNPARTFSLKAKTSFFGGHSHRTSEHTARGIDTIIDCYSIGCLCELNPAYWPYNEWNHGFAYIHVEDSEVKFFNAKIENGKVK